MSFDSETRSIPGVTEAEAMPVLKRTAGNAGGQNMRSFAASRWSGDAQVWWTGAKPGDVLELGIDVAESGRYRVELACTKARDYAVVQFSLDGSDLDAPIDFYDAKVVSTGPLFLGEVDLEPGQRRLGVRIVGANPKAIKSYMFGLDWVRLIPVQP